MWLMSPSWKEPEVSRTVPVRPDGIFHCAGKRRACGGSDAQQLAAQIAGRLGKYVTNPQVTVIVTAINSQRIYILGEVVRAGAYPLLPGMTVLQALSTAGGFTQFANTKNIYVLREEEGRHAKYPFNYKEVVQRGNTAPEHGAKGRRHNCRAVGAVDVLVSDETFGRVVS